MRDKACPPVGATEDVPVESVMGSAKVVQAIRSAGALTARYLRVGQFNVGRVRMRG